MAASRGRSTWSFEDTNMLWLVGTFCLFVLLRWIALRKRLAVPDVKSASANSAAAIPAGFANLHLAIRREIWAWLYTLLALAAIFAGALIWVHFFGPIKPVHEWLR